MAAENNLMWGFLIHTISRVSHLCQDTSYLYRRISELRHSTVASGPADLFSDGIVGL